MIDYYTNNLILNTTVSIINLTRPLIFLIYLRVVKTTGWWFNRCVKHLNDISIDFVNYVMNNTVNVGSFFLFHQHFNGYWLLCFRIIIVDIMLLSMIVLRELLICPFSFVPLWYRPIVINIDSKLLFWFQRKKTFHCFIMNVKLGKKFYWLNLESD